jgi:2-oxo-hept-3-ene-1,7-dioate hydratase
MLDERSIEDAAARLDEAERTRQQIRMLSLQYPDMAISDAYRIQAAWMRRKLGMGRRVIGHKIGLTSRAMQLALGIDEPDSGVLLDDMLFADGAQIPCSRFIGLRIEVELVFVLKAALRGPQCTIFDVLDATDYIAPAFEILDTRIFRKDAETGKTRTVRDTIADNAANAGIVVGGRPVRPDAVDLRWIGAICSKNGAVEETGLAAGVLNHPAHAVAWLANKLHPLGSGLEAGQLVLSGSFTRPIEVGPGDIVQAEYGPLGTVACSFA